jgi:hypothetical protein
MKQLGQLRSSRTVEGRRQKTIACPTWQATENDGLPHDCTIEMHVIGTLDS